jgi:hypothetical protein
MGKERLGKPAHRGTVVVCAGSHCRKAGSQRRLCEALSDAGLTVVPAKCLGVCNGPVVAASIKDRVEVISRVKGSGARTRLVAALGSGRRKPVKRLLVKGGKRERALRRVARVLARVP